MLFAAVDAWHYFRRTGPYSDAALRARGLSLATEGNFPDWRKWPFGRIVFVSTSGSLVSWVIMYVSDGPMSHTAMVYGDGILNDVTSAGVHRRPISDYLDGKSYMCVVPPPKGTDLDFARRFMDRILGSGYNYVGVLLLGMSILIGNNASFSWRAVVDILCVIGSAALFSYVRTDSIPLVTLGLAAGYAAVVLVNRLRLSRRERIRRTEREA